MSTLPPWFGTIYWAQRSGETQTEPDGVLLEIRPGELDSVATALRRIWKQFADTESWPRLLGEVVGPVWQEVERGLGSVDICRYLSTAEGRVLDEIGALFDQERLGLSDDLYRLAIQAKAGKLSTSGTAPELLELVLALLGPEVSVQDVYPAGVLIQAPDVSPEIFALMLDVLNDATSAGVGLSLSTFPTGIGTMRSTRPGAIYTLPAGILDSTRGGAAAVSFFATVRGAA